ncbi:MAG: hypothetical protein PHD95_06215 [Candidatus ainarchaeum sp.]|nr:hypothetical protein [Candidatus ainarchaeum sp.]
MKGLFKLIIFSIILISIFSEYNATSLSLTVTGDSNAGREYFTRDGNLTVTFTYKDTNYQDQNRLAWGKDSNFSVSIYLSKKQCGQHYLLYTDLNILDNNGISCSSNGFGSQFLAAADGFRLGVDQNTINDDDANISTTQTCSISLDLSKYADSGQANFTHFKWPTFNGLTKRATLEHPDLRSTIMGQFYIDVNISAPRDATLGDNICASSDANTIINKPQLNLWDSNFNNSYGATFFDFNRVGMDATNPDGNLVIDFNISLRDTNLSLADMNLSIYYSQTQGDRNNVMFRDINLGKSMLPNAKNYYPIYCDYNRAGSSGGTADENYSTNLDTNCWMQWDMRTVREGRYFIDMILAPSTDNNRGAGSWVFDTKNQYATLASHPLKDTNSTLNPAGINDTNIPTLSLSGDSTSTGLCVGVTMDANDTSNIKKFWYSSNGADYLDNGRTNVYNVCITSSTPLPAILNYYFKAMDFMDLNSSAQPKTITFSSPSGGSSNPPAATPAETPASPGGGATTGTGTTPTTETIVEQAIEGSLTGEEITSILTEAGYDNVTSKMLETAQEVQVTQGITVEKNTSATGAVSYKATVTISLTNDSTKDWKNAKLVVEIPKTVAASASEITSSYAMKVLKSDPIIEFTVAEVKAGETASVAYEISKNITSAIANTIRSPIVAGFTEVKAPTPPAVPKCGNGTCESGETNANCPADCPATVPPAMPPANPPATGGIDLATVGIIIIIAIAIVAIGISVSRRKKNKLGYKK